MVAKPTVIRVCELSTCHTPFKTRDKRKRYCNPRHKNAAAQQRFRKSQKKKRKKSSQSSQRSQRSS